VKRAWKRREAPALFLAAGALATGMLFVLTRLPNSAEYKFAFATCFCLLPLTASRIQEWVGRGERTRVAWAAAALVLVWLVGLGFSLRYNVPWRTLAQAVAIDESGFAIRVPPGPESDWIDAIRERTPAESLLLVEGSSLPISLLAERSSYLAVDAGDAGRSGYSMRVETLLEQNGYPPDEIARRKRVIDAAFASHQTDFEQLTAELMRFQRPVSIVFRQDGGTFLSWLRARGVGREIFRAHGRVVWLIDPD
jgi:hypothetical protein